MTNPLAKYLPQEKKENNPLAKYLPEKQSVSPQQDVNPLEKYLPSSPTPKPYSGLSGEQLRIAKERQRMIDTGSIPETITPESQKALDIARQGVYKPAPEGYRAASWPEQQIGTPINHNDIVELWKTLKTPAKMSREGWQLIFDNIEPILGLSEQEQDKYWGTIFKGLPRAVITTITDMAALRLEPEVIAASGLLKFAGPIIAETRIGEAFAKIGNKDLAEIVYRGRFKGMKEAAQAMGEKFPELKTQIGDDGILNELRKLVKAAGGWSKMKPDKISKLVADIKSFNVRPTVSVTPELLPLKPPISATTAPTKATTSAVKGIAPKPPETALKSTIEKAGAEYLGIQKSPGMEDIALFNDPISHTTLALPISEVTEQAVTAEITPKAEIDAKPTDVNIVKPHAAKSTVEKSVTAEVKTPTKARPVIFEDKPQSVSEAQYIKSIPLFKREKALIVADIEAAIKKAPSAAPYEVDKKFGKFGSPEKYGYAKFKLDGGAKVINNKYALTEFLSNVKKLSANRLSTPEPRDRQVGLSALATAKRSEMGELIKGIKGYYTDGKLLIKGTPPKTAKFGKREANDDMVRAVKTLLSKKTEPAEFVHYGQKSTGIGGQVDIVPVADMEKATGKFIKENPPSVIFKTNNRYVAYNQFLFNPIRNTFPNARYGIAENGALVAYVKDEPVATLMPTATSVKGKPDVVFTDKSPFADIGKSKSETAPTEVLKDYPELQKSKTITAPKPEVKPVENVIAEAISTEPAEKYIDKAVLKDIDSAQSAFDGVEGRVSIPSADKLLEPIKNAYNKVHDWMFTFGEARRVNPQLYDKLMRSFSERNAGIEKAIDDVEKLLAGKKISLSDDVEMALTFEDKTLSPRPEIKEMYNRFKELLERIEGASIRKGIFKQPFQERMITENIEKIKELRAQKGSIEEIKTLLEENQKLSQMRYLPHRSVVARVLESKINKLTGEPRKKFLESASRISAKYKMRTGRKFLQEYLNSGLLKTEDIGMRKLAIETLDNYYYRSALQDLYDYAKDQNLIRGKSENLLNEGWLQAREIGITAPELKNQVVHPLLAESLAEMKEMKKGGRGGLARQIMGMVKVAQFIKPQIIWIYDGVQKVMRGAWSMNPVKEVKELANAFNDVTNKTDRYHELNKLNLYSFPYETPKAAKDEQVKMMLRKTQADIPGYVKMLEKITDMSWAKGDISPQDLIMSAYRAMSNVTWIGDKVIRTQSVGILEKMGYSTEEAVKIASRGHGAYSELSLKFKKTMSPLVFVHTFRVLMPIEMAKIVGEPIKGILDWKAKESGKKPRKSDVERWAKAIAATIIMPVAIDQYLKSRGFKTDKFGWKWSKRVDKDKEIVVGVNYIINMPLKYWHRLTAYNPINPTYRGIQGVTNFIKWEVHPITRIFFWDIVKNQKSFGHGEYVYDPNETDVFKQTSQILRYSFGQGFRLYGKMMDAADAGTITPKEKAENEKILKENLSGLDRTLFGVFGYAYVRKGLQQRKQSQLKWLDIEFYRRRASIIKKYNREDANKRIAKLNEWKKECRKWVNENMK